MNRAFDPLSQPIWQVLVAFWPLWAVLSGLIIIQVVIAIYRERQLARAGIADIDRMEGITFERYLVGLFRRLGYAVELTPARGDYGADLILSKDGLRTAVQAKRYAKNVGVKAVQEVVTAQKMYKCTQAMVVTNSGYTQQARQLARANGVILWDRQYLVKTILSAQQKQEVSISTPNDV